jgi:hypothetical protein
MEPPPPTTRADWQRALAKLPQPRPRQHHLTSKKKPYERSGKTALSGMNLT